MDKEQLNQIKLQAKNEVMKERSEELVKKLKSLYEKKYAAEQVVKNIDREISDYEMELEGK